MEGTTGFKQVDDTCVGVCVSGRTAVRPTMRSPTMRLSCDVELPSILKDLILTSTTWMRTCIHREMRIDILSVGRSGGGSDHGWMDPFQSDRRCSLGSKPTARSKNRRTSILPFQNLVGNTKGMNLDILKHSKEQVARHNKYQINENVSKYSHLVLLSSCISLRSSALHSSRSLCKSQRAASLPSIQI